MKSVSRLALGAALAVAASGVFVSASADAQRAPRANSNNNNQRAQQPPQAQFQVAGRSLTLSREERTALTALQTAAAGTDRAAQDAALAAARAAVRGPDARYAMARFQMQIAIQRSDNAMLGQAVDIALDSGVAPPNEVPTYLRTQFDLANQARDFQKAERALTRLVQLEPNNPEIQLVLAQLRVNQGRPAEGIRALTTAIEARQAAGQPAPEAWHRYALRHSYESRDPAVRGQAIRIARGLVAAYPTQVNWRDALLILREVGTLDAAAQLDLWRLMLAANALAGERDYYDFANTLNQGGYPGEAKAVLDAGVRARMVDAGRSPFRELMATANGRVAADRAELAASQRSALAAATGTPALRTGDAFFGYGRYPEAIALYQAALQKGGVDAATVNTRLGIAYALSGQRALAETAFRAVTGPRAEIAQFWLLWLQQRPAS
jgi:predicted Zn-dependent protease